MIILVFVWHKSIQFRRRYARTFRSQGPWLLAFRPQMCCPNYSCPALYGSTRLEFLSQAHTVVWECCKDDRQSQWGMAKFDSQPTLNPWTDRHQIWNTWLRRGHVLPQKIRGQSAQGFSPRIREIYTQNLRMFTSFFLSSSEGLQTRSLDRFSRLIRHMTWFCAR